MNEGSTISAINGWGRGISNNNNKYNDGIVCNGNENELQSTSSASTPVINENKQN